MTTAWATHPTGIRLPFMWTWIEILRTLGRQLGPSGRDAVRRVSPGVVGALVPEWNDGDRLNFPTLLPANGFALIEGVSRALRELSTISPLLLVIDDMQLIDVASRDILALLMAQLSQLPIVIIGNWTYFGSDRPMNRRSFQQILTSANTVPIHLPGLDDAATALLVESLTGTPSTLVVSEQLRTHAGGNPFYIKELVRARDVGREPGASVGSDHRIPEAIVGVVGRRLSNLDRHGRDLLAAAAVIGPDFDIAELADVVDLPVSTVRKGLRPAYETGLIDEFPSRPRRYRFSHGLLRDAILTQMPAEDRSRVHAAITMCAGSGLDYTGYEQALGIADHAWRAGTDINADYALQVHESMIRRAVGRSAYDDIADLADHALQISRRLPPKPEYLHRQAELWLHVAGAKGILEGHSSESAAVAVQRAFEIGTHAKGRSFYGAVALQGFMLCAGGRLDEAQVVATGLGTEYERSADPDAGVAAHYLTVIVQVLRGDLLGALTTGHAMMRTFPVPTELTDPLHFFHPQVYCFMAIAEAVRGHRDAATGHCHSARDIAQSHGDVFNVLATKLALIQVDAIVGITDGVAAAADIVHRELVSAGGHQRAATALVYGAWARTLAGGQDDSVAAADAFGVYTADGNIGGTPLLLALLADIEIRLGRLGNARDLLARARAHANATGEHVWDRMLDSRAAATALCP